MDPPKRFEEPMAEGHIIHIECQEKAERGDCKSQPRRQSPRHATSPKTVSSPGRILLAITLCLLVVLVFFTTAPQRVLRRISCHGDRAEEPTIGPEPESTPFSSLLNGASPETLGDILHKYFPTRYQHGVWPSERHTVEAIQDAPLTTTLVRLARRQDNSTTSSTSSSSSSSSSSSTSPPPARGGDSTTSTSATTSTTTTTSSSSTSQSTSATAEPSPTVNQQNPSTTTIPATITTSTTLPGGQVVPLTLTSSRTSKVVIATLTSTLSNGNVVVVTSTSFVPPDPVVTMETTTMHPPSLHNAAVKRHQIGGVVLAGMMGVMAGAALV